MLRVDVDSRRSARSEDVLHDLEVRFPNIYNRRRQRRARQEALQLSDSSFSENGETSTDIFGRQDDRLMTSRLHTRNDDVWSSKQSGRRRHSSATFNDKEEKLRCENGLRNSKWRLRSLEDLANDGSKFGNGLRDSKSSSDSFEEFPRRYNKRRNTSPDVLFVPETKSTALKERLKHNAERLNDLLYNKSPFSKGQGHFTPRSDENVIWEKEENERVSSLEGENTKKIPNGDARKPSSRFELYRMMFENGDRAEKERKSDYIFNSRWRQNAERIAVPRIQDRSTMFVSQSPQQSPESQADSAIDVESVSVQSELSVDNHSNDINCDINPTESHKQFHEKDDPELTSLDQWSTNDSRNRPLHSLPDFVGDLAIRSLLSFSTEHEHSSGEESAPKSNTESPRSLSPLVSPKRFRLQGQTTPKRSGPVRGDHNLSSTSPGSLSEREQQENYLISHGFANGPLVTSSDDLDDAVDDTDPSIESPQPATPGRVHTKSRKQVYLVKTSSESPRYGRITPISGPSEPQIAGRPSEGKILLDMRYHSFDQFSGKGTQGCDIKSEHHHLKSLKSKSLNDVFDGDMDTKYKMILQNGGPGYKFDQKNNNEYCSSTDSPLKSKSCISFNNFTLSPRTELEKDEEELIVVMDNIGESRTEDNLSDVQPSSESASISDHSIGNSESSSQRTIPAAIVHQASKTPEMINNENRTVHCSREVYSSESEKFDQSFDSRTSDCDTEFFMEAEFLDSAMKPKKTTFQKLFGGKKGKYNPAAEDVSKLPQSHEQSKSNSVSKSLPNHDRVENAPGPRQGNHKTGTPRQKAGQSETRTSGKDVRFSVIDENDQGCVNTFNGGLVRAGRISAFEAATLKESPELENLNLSCDGSTQFHSKPVVISSGKGSCLDMSCNSFSKDGDDSRTNKVQGNLSTITAGSSMHKTKVDMKETLENVNPRSFQDSDSTITNISLKSFPNSSMTTEETINSPQSPDTIDDVFEDSPRSLTSSLKSHQYEGEVPSFLSEGFDHHDSFEEKFHQDLKLNHSGSDFTSSHNTSNSPRSVWSEFEGPNTVDQSFEDSFESSFNASSLNARSFGDVLSKEDNSKDEREKSSGYASENSPQSSETKDDFMDEDKSSQRHDDVARAPFKDEVDRIFELAKDPPSFGDDSDIEEELSFADLDRQLRSSTELSVVKEAAAESDSDVPSPGKDQKVAPANKQKMSIVPKPILSNHSPRMAYSSKYSKNEDVEPASITSDDNNNENSDCMSSETSEVIRSAFDFLGSSSEVEPLASARETLMMLEEEDSEEEQDLASSIKMLSDLRRSLVIENQDILLADGILTEKDFPDSPIEKAEEPSQPNISEDEDSSFQLDPRPAGVHSEIQVDIHRPNVEDSDNGSEKDVPLDAMDDDSLFEGGPMLHPNPENEVTTPKPEDFEDDEHPLNRTYVVSVDFCEDNSLSEGQTSFGCEHPKKDKSLADELKLPLWDDDQVSSGYSTPRAENQTNMEENLHETTLEESSSDLNMSFKENDCERKDTVTQTVTPNIAKDSSDNAKEETNEKRSGQRYIKKSQMDKKKILLRRQKECIHEDPNENETLDQAVDSRRASIGGDSSNRSDSEKIEPESSQSDAESNKSAKDQSPRSDQSEESRNFSGSFNRLSSGTGFYTDSVKEFSLDSGDSPRSLIQTDLPDASVNLSDEINVNASLDDVFFDDLNESFKSNHNHSSGPLPSTRAYAYRKSSEGEDSSSMMSEESSRGVPPDRKFSLPDVVLNQGSSFMPMSDSSIEISSLTSDTEVVASSMENSVLSDIQEESYELSYNSFISPYATTKSLAKISSTPKSLYRSKTAELSCGVEPVYDPYSTIDSRGDNSNESDRRCSSASDISPYATINDSLRLNDGVLLTSKDNVVEKSTENSTPSPDIPDSVTRTIPEIWIQAPTDDEVGNESYTGKDVMDLYAKINKAQSKGDNQPESRECSPQHTASKGGNSAEPVEPEELGAVGGCEEVIETDDEGPPLPQRKYERSISSQSNLQSNREVSASRTSLFSNFKSSARDRFRTMRKAMSVDRGLDEAHELEKKAEKKEKAEKGKEKNKKDKKDKKKKKEEKISKAPSLKSLTSIFGKKSKDKSSAIEDEVEEKKDEMSEKKIKKGRGSIFGSKKKRLVTVPIDIVDVPTHFRCIGKLKEVNPDGTQLVELNKPVDGPIGFYIAKGTANYDYGTFVSRFTDDQQKLFAGILGIGDEILEINEQSVKDMSLDDVHALMASTETLNMKIFPIVARKEV